MEAIVLAGGFGTRLRSVVSDVPKPMAPVAGRPFLDILLRSLASKGVTRAILSIGYLAERITDYFTTHDPGIDLAFEIESEPLGTGGAIAAALRRSTADGVFVFNGDTYLDLEIGMLAALWPGDRTPIVVARSVADTARYGRLETAGSRITRFRGAGIEGPGLINAGTYLIPRDIFAGADLPRAFSFERDYLERRPAASLRVFPTAGRFIDIGVPEDYQRAQGELAGVAASRRE